MTIKRKKKEKRFITTVSENNDMLGASLVIVDKETGVNYFYYCGGFSGGLTPLLDKNGKPIITELNDKTKK